MATSSRDLSLGFWSFQTTREGLGASSAMVVLVFVVGGGVVVKE